jgi:hypothetical protein
MGHDLCKVTFHPLCCLPIKQFIVTRLDKRDKKTKSKMEATLFICFFLWINRVSLIDKSVKIILAFRYVLRDTLRQRVLLNH